MKLKRPYGIKMFDLLNLDKFYSENPVETWKKVLGVNMHYHSALSNDKGYHPMEYAIMEMYQHIPHNSKILDCGCGWGGPATQIIRDLNCDVTGVTISKSQAEYITNFPVIQQDLHNIKLNENYDIALFVECYSHLENPIQVLKKLRPYVNKVIIRDYLNTQGNFVKYDTRWKMTIANKAKYVQDLKVAGFKIENFQVREHNYQPESTIWLNNILTLDKKEITGQIKLLYDSCTMSLRSQGPENVSGVSICTIVGA